MNKKPSYYAVIPAKVRYCKALPDKAKLLYGEITCLAGDNGYCWARNQYFSELYEVHKKTISRLIGLLEEHGFIKTEVIREGNQVIERRIFIDTYPQNQGDPIHKNADTPIHKNAEDINTSINNTRLIKDNVENLLSLWNSFDNLANHKEATFKRNLKPTLIKKLNSYLPGEIEQAIKNYAGILKSEKHRWTYQWPLWEFLSKGLDKFLDECKPWDRELMTSGYQNKPPGYTPIVQKQIDQQEDRWNEI